MNIVEAKFHGSDQAAAIERAKKLDCMVIWSIAPGTESVQKATAADWGYWSDNSMIRNWERVIYPTTNH